ncbi:hypothetical protein CKF54_06735 [Psittacicella hinzii]|uniref:Periplasmic chaperone PpiD n=1 Tax=Psittacicella hinzii TaxID=2028575 RepID=A0A3A1Y5Q8_9GAMM|nr:SurA N-terminal domain-containing protein [Psittacicella hinzii]RIY31394.1 hypothetical protein CKF54_06735 [Psittacicella hinzii]
MIGKFNSIQKSFLFKLVPVAIAIPFIIQTITGSRLGIRQPNYLVSFSNKDVGIQYNEFQQAYQQRYNQLLQSYGQEEFEKFMTPANEQLLRMAVLDNLINDRLRLLYANDIGVSITDNEIIQNIRNNSMFHGADGQYSEDRIRAFLNYYGLTTQQYFGILANQMRDQFITNLLNNSYVTTDKELDTNIRLSFATAHVQVAQLDASANAASIEATAEQVQNYYDLHRDNYAIPAKASLSFIRYNRAELAAKAPKPTEEEMRAYYDVNPQLFNSSVYDLSAIVVDNEETANKVIEALKNGMSFTEAVKTYSTDVAARFNDGSLGNLSTNQLPAYFKNVVPEMQVHTYSNPVKDSDGKYHIAFLNAKQSSTVSYADAKAQINSTLTRANEQTYLQNLFAKVQEVVESYGNISQVAKILELPVITTSEFTSSSLPSMIPSDVARLAFTGDMQVNRVNSPQGIADSNDEIITQLDSYTASEYPTLEEVKDRVTADTKLALAQEANLAKLNELAPKLEAASVEEAKNLLADAKVTLSAEQEVQLMNPTKEQSPYLEALFTSAYKGNPVDYLVVNDTQDNRVYLLAVHGFTVENAAPAEVLKQFKDNYNQVVTYDYNNNFMQQLRKVYDVKINYELLGNSSN